MSYTRRVRRLWVYLVVDGGVEVLAGWAGPGGTWVPLLADTHNAALALRPLAERLAAEKGCPMRLVVFDAS